MGWKEVDSAINACIDATQKAKVAAKLAAFHAEEAQEQNVDAQEWLAKFRRKALLFKKDAE